MQNNLFIKGLVLAIIVLFVGIHPLPTVKGNAAELDIIVNDTPDPFNPLVEDCFITITNVGSIPVKTNLTIWEANRFWNLGQVNPGGSVQAIWDGTDNKGNLVPVEADAGRIG